MAVQKEPDYAIDYGDPAASAGISVFSEQFDDAFYYDGDDLGARYAADGTDFKLWAPTAFEAFLVLYESWQGEPQQVLAMERSVKGTWALTVREDLEGRYYTYRVRIGDQWNEAVDPYARAVGVNGDRGYLTDLSRTTPSAWLKTDDGLQDAGPEPVSAVDAVIYEVNVRDFTVHPASGAAHKGKFLGLSESGTRGPGGIKTGLDHLADLGVTHVQLMPVYDFSTESVDETRLEDGQYNWGYDPKNYNVPEGSYATDPYDPAARVRELKELIAALHSRGLRVIMDVVYNHMYDAYRANLTKLVPGYYFRYKSDGTLSDGSFCGNEMASERRMVRKFILDSVLYWAKEYRMDGFRFDLMGLLDVGTMTEIRMRLDEIDPSMILIGEGWIMETELPWPDRANQQQADRLPRIGQFNDVLRDAVKGNIFDAQWSRGFIGGDTQAAFGVKLGIVGGIPYHEGMKLFAQEPGQCVNYAECHDNRTLWDGISLSAGERPEEVRRQMHRLASAIVLTSQGIPFLHAGQEFMRTKNGVENSYNSPDEINMMDWDRCFERRDDVAYLKALIALRAGHPAFRMRSAEEIRSRLYFEHAAEHCIAYTLRDHAGGDAAAHLYVLYHAAEGDTTLYLPELGEWKIVFGVEHVRRLEAAILEAGGIGMIVLAVS
ncbi:type I pullulanase [Paenibacillus sp. FJAT-26967]|uniref:type I pullulanase n=1 Tax=Paenibacillus sp. FJAT-26967 TaxID=1729690 RepID=UPI000838D098|nr:type I pullulanase [Paenibacillus sp. FJAT-26967]